MLNIAAVQIDYLLAFKDMHHQAENDYMAVPLSILKFDLGDVQATRELKEWRTRLRIRYESQHLKKLVAIIRYCRSQGADVVAFPEYSVPASALPAIQSLSRDLNVTVVAGTHFVELDARAREAYGKIAPTGLDLAGLQRRAICPVFIRGTFYYLQKLTSSKFEQDVGVPQDEQDVRWGTIDIPFQNGSASARVLVCSDYLENNRGFIDQVTRGRASQLCDITFVVSCTPAIGLFGGRARATTINEEADASPIQMRAHKDRVLGPVVFVNIASRGGTKIFYDQREPNYYLQEANDGTFGAHSMGGAVTGSSGLPGGSEGIVIVEVDKEEGALRGVRQATVIPIMHSSGPDDEFICEWKEFIEAYRRGSDLDEKKQVILAQDARLEELGKKTINQILKQKVDFVRAHYDEFPDEVWLDEAVVPLCVISGEAVHRDVWEYRAARATDLKLDEIKSWHPGAVQTTPWLTKLKASCSKIVHDRSGSVPRIERTSAERLASPQADEYLDTSAAFYRLITSESSSVRACANAARWVLDLLNFDNYEDALSLIEHVIEYRPYPAIRIMKPVRNLLLADGGAPSLGRREHASSQLRQFIEQHNNSERLLAEAARRFMEVGAGDWIFAYGYTEAVHHVLRVLSKKVSASDIRVVVSEVGNRLNNGEGVKNAEVIRGMGYNTTYVSDISVARILSEAGPHMRWLLMGFKMASGEGVVNTVGSLSMAEIARQHGVEVIFVGYSFDLWPAEIWDEERQRVLTETRKGLWVNDGTRNRLEGQGIDVERLDFASDLVPWDCISSILTDEGLEPAERARAAISIAAHTGVAETNA